MEQQEFGTITYYEPSTKKYAALGHGIIDIDTGTLINISSGELVTAKILSIINEHNLNLIYLESRPSKEVFGEYNFFCDVDRGIEDIKEALDEIKNECNFYKLLGSYGNI